MALRTYGEKPKSFQIEDNGEYYCMGSEVGNYLGFFRGTLYKRYPGMFRRSINNHERKKLVKLGLNQYVPTSIVCLVRANEVEDIIKGNDHKYKIPVVHSSAPPASRKGKSRKPMPWITSLTNSSHPDAVPQARPINPHRVHNQIARMFPERFDDTIRRSVNLRSAAQQEILMPMRFGEGIAGQELKDNYTWNNNAKADSREDFIAIETAPENTDIHNNLAQFETAYNYDCRICLKNSDKFWEIFQTQNLAEKIMSIAFVQVQYGDGLPSVICLACRQLLDMFYDFKCLVEKSDAALRNTLLSRMEMNRDTITESLSQPVHNDFQMQYESQLLSLQNFNRLVSNDYNNKQNLVPYEIHEECINNNKHLCKEETELTNGNNVLVERDDDLSGPEIIPISERSEMLLKNRGSPRSKLIDTMGQSMESETVPIKQEELFLPEETNLLERKDDHQADETIFHSDLKFELKNNSLSVGEGTVDDVSSSKSESMNCRTYIRESNSEEDKSFISRLSQQKCPHCFESFATNVDLQIHMTIHEEVNKLRYTCYWCEKQFSDIATLINHVSNDHASSNTENDIDIGNNYGRVETARKVDTLDEVFGSSINKGIVEKKDYKLECESFPSDIKTFPEYKKCETSNNHSNKFVNMKESLEHQKDLFNSKMTECNSHDLPLEGLHSTKPDKLFTTKGNLKRHISTHSSLKLNCATCGMEFSQLDKLKEHKRSKHKEEIFGPSDNGDDGAGNERKTSDGMESRRKEKKCRPHQCAMCSKAFAQPQSLANHMEQHKRENEPQKRFFCEVCGKCFAQIASLVAHTRTHTVVKAFGVQCTQ